MQVTETASAGLKREYRVVVPATDLEARVNERLDTEFRAEFYNAWNHTQFANPDGNFSDLTFGQVVKTREGPRVLQFGLKLLF